MIHLINREETLKTSLREQLLKNNCTIIFFFLQDINILYLSYIRLWTFFFHMYLIYAKSRQNTLLVYAKYG